MRYYELIYLASSDLSEKINSFIQEEAGAIEKTTKPFKREEEFLASLNFYLSPEKLESLEKKLKSDSQILRYMILAKKIPKKIPAKEIFPKRKIAIPRRMEPILRGKPKKVDLKEIDKKIEEILKE